MKKIFLLSLLLFSLSTQAQDRDFLETQLAKILAYDTNITFDKAPGYLIGVMDGDSTHVFQYGTFSKADKRQPDANTLFEIGGLTKVYTAALVGILAQSEDLDLYRSINDYLPEEYKNETADSITLFRLLTHTAKLPRMPIGIGVNQTKNNDPFAQYSPEDLLAFYKDFDFEEEEPRKKKRKKKSDYFYSHVGYGLLQLAIEQVTQQTYEECLKQKLLMPLGLNDTYVTVPESAVNRFIPGHTFSGLPVGKWHYQSFQASVGIKTTMADFLKFTRILIDDENEQLSPILNATTRKTFKTDRGKKIYVGMAWHIIVKKKKYDIVAHPGATDGHRADIHFVKRTRTAVAVFSNSEYHMDNVGAWVLAMLNNYWKRGNK